MNNILGAAVMAIFIGASGSVAAAPGVPGLSMFGLDNFLGLGDFSGASTNAVGLLQVVLVDPEPLVGIATGTGLPLVQGVVPVLDVLMSNPLELPTFFFEEGGSILAPSLSGVPPLPLLNRGLDGL